MEEEDKKQLVPSLATPGAIPNVTDGLGFYFAKIKQFPMLSEEDEFMLAKRWQEHQDPKAAEKLVSSHLRLVAKIANGYRGYGLPITDMIAEGNIGLLQALRKFDPDKGYRFSTYAMWWIRANIQEYILHSWSLVKIGTTAAQKKLFFSLRRLKSELSESDSEFLTNEDIKKIATDLNVPEREVVSMNRRLQGHDSSLNATLKAAGTEEWQDWLVDERDNQETRLIEGDTLEKGSTILDKAMNALSEKEHFIISQRRLLDKPRTLDDLAGEMNLSRERIRQIEVKAFNKLQKSVKSLAIQGRISGSQHPTLF